MDSTIAWIYELEFVGENPKSPNGFDGWKPQTLESLHHPWRGDEGELEVAHNILERGLHGDKAMVDNWAYGLLPFSILEISVFGV